MASSVTTTDDVHKAATNIGVKMAADEVEDYHKLLASADETFARLMAMPEYHLPVDLERFPRSNIYVPSPTENKLGVAWAHKFSVGGADKNPSGLLAGKTLCLKDNTSVAGVPMINGSDIISPWTPKSDATVVTRILEAGGEIIGTATCENMSYSPASNTSTTGTVHNPYAEGYSAGGSSSGVGALVGSPENLVDMGIGADQGGSIRIPASASGAVGLKPTHGLVPYTGLVTSEAIMDHAGPICKNVMDVAVLLEVVAGRDGIDDRAVGVQKHGEIKYSSDLKRWFDNSLQVNGGLNKVLTGMKIGILKEGMEAPFMQAALKEKVYDSAFRLRQLGAEVTEVSMPMHTTGRDIWMAIRRLGGALTMLGKGTGRKQYALTPFLEKFLPMTQDKWDRVPVNVKSTIINGTNALEKYPTLYAKALNLAIQLSKEYEDLLSTYTVLLMPTLSRTPPRHADRNSGPLARSQSEQGLALNTAQFDLTGHPAMSLPVGFLPDIDDPDVLLPVGMQIVGPLHGEEKVLKVGFAWEQRWDWKKEVGAVSKEQANDQGSDTVDAVSTAGP